MFIYFSAIFLSNCLLIKINQSLRRITTIPGMIIWKIIPITVGALLFVAISNIHIDNITTDYIIVQTKTVNRWARYAYLFTRFILMASKPISPTMAISAKINKEQRNALKDKKSARINNMSRMSTARAKFFIFFESCSTLSSLMRFQEKVQVGLVQFDSMNSVFQPVCLQLNQVDPCLQLAEKQQILYFQQYPTVMRLRCLQEYKPNHVDKYSSGQSNLIDNANLYSTASNNGSRLKYIDKQAYTATNTQLSSPSEDGSRISLHRPIFPLKSSDKGSIRYPIEEPKWKFQRVNSSPRIQTNIRQNYSMSQQSSNQSQLMNRNNFTFQMERQPSAHINYNFSNGMINYTQHDTEKRNIFEQLKSRSQQLEMKNKELSDKNNQVLKLEQEQKLKWSEIKDLENTFNSLNQRSNLGTYPTLIQQADRLRKQLAIKNEQLSRIKQNKEQEIQQVHQLRYMVKNFQNRIYSLEQKLKQSYDAISFMNSNISKLESFQHENKDLKQRIKNYEQMNKKIGDQNKKLNNMVQFQEGISEQSISSQQNSLFYPFHKYHQNTMSMEDCQLDYQVNNEPTFKKQRKTDKKLKQLEERQKKLEQKQKKMEERLKLEERKKQLERQSREQDEAYMLITVKRVENQLSKQRMYQQQQIEKRQKKLQLELLQHRLKLLQRENKQLQTEQKYIQNRSRSRVQSHQSYQSGCEKFIQMNDDNNFRQQPKISMLDQVQRNPYSFQINQENQQITHNFSSNPVNRYKNMPSFAIEPYSSNPYLKNEEIPDFNDKSVIEKLIQFEELHNKISAFRKQNYSELSQRMNANEGDSINRSGYNK